MKTNQDQPEPCHKAEGSNIEQALLKQMKAWFRSDEGNLAKQLVCSDDSDKIVEGLSMVWSSGVRHGMILSEATSDFTKKLLEQQEEMPGELSELLDEHLLDLTSTGPSEPIEPGSGPITSSNTY